MKKIIQAPYIDQTKDWPTGCESVSAVMLLQYIGIDVMVSDFVNKYLEKQEMFVKQGVLYGADPRESFVGSPADPSSYGCYAPVIANALERALLDLGSALPEGYNIEDLTNVSLERIQKEYIDCDMPVIFWASLDMKPTIIGPVWTIPKTEKEFTWISNEHCLLLVGYDDENYYFNDPWQNHGTIPYEKRLVEQRHMEQHRMAVSLRKNG